MMLLNQFNALAIGQLTNTTKLWDLTQAVQKVKSFFLVGYEDFSTISSQLNNHFSVDINMDTAQSFHLKSLVLVETMETISTKVRSKYAPKGYFLMRTYLVIGHVRTAFIEFSDSIKKGNYGFVTNVSQSKSNGLHSGLTKKLYIAVAKIITVKISKMIEKNLIINYLPCLFSFSRQVAITQAEKLVFSFFACCSISSIRTWGKRIAFLSDLLFLLPVAIIMPYFNLLVWGHYTRSFSNKKVLTCGNTLKYSEHTPDKYIRHKKTIPRSVGAHSRDLTTNIKDTNAMANSNNTLHPKIGQQSKLFKFYDRATTQVVQSIAPTERQARKNLGKQSLIFIARIRLYPVIERANNRGGYSYV